MTREDRITEEDVYQEHLAAVNATAHWIYLFGIIGGSFLLMLILIAILGSTAG